MERVRVEVAREAKVAQQQQIPQTPYVVAIQTPWYCIIEQVIFFLQLVLKVFAWNFFRANLSLL